jgi:hypothetical protein
MATETGATREKMSGFAQVLDYQGDKKIDTRIKI